MKRVLPFLTALLLFGACGPPREQGGRSVIQNKGSDTLVNVAQAWAERYKDVRPEVAVAVTGGGSGTGISALINGTVDIASASRKMKDKEIELAREHGIEPVEHVVGFDALAVFLHPNHPAEGLSLAQLAAIYGEGGEADVWSQLGYEVPGCESDEIVRVSRQNNSGTYVYFKVAVLGKDREYKLGSRDMHGSKDVVDLVAHTPCAIGYSGLAYATPEVKMPCIMVPAGDASAAAGDGDAAGDGEAAPEGEAEDGPAEGGETCVAPSPQTANDGTYPIARPLLMYTRGEPEGAVKDYLDWILSDAGQCIIQDKGYAPARPVTCG